MKKEYGKKKAEAVFYASKNKGTIKGVEKKSKKSKTKSSGGKSLLELLQRVGLTHKELMLL